MEGRRGKGEDGRRKGEKGELSRGATEQGSRGEGENGGGKGEGHPFSIFLIGEQEVL